MNWVFLCCVVFAVSSSLGAAFVKNQKHDSRRILVKMQESDEVSPQSGGYKKMLMKMKAKSPSGGRGGAFSPVVDAVAPAVSNAVSGNSKSKRAWVRPDESLTASAKTRFKNKVPFDGDMYETIKATIELLSGRAEGKILTTEQAEWLKSAVEIIIEDAHAFGPPAKPERKEFVDGENGEEDE